MSDHMTEWLGAYHDGELRGSRLHQVEHHLEECAACQAELEGLQGLSALLRDTAPAEDLIPTERFVANLTLSLPRQSEPSKPRKVIEFGWWLLPVGVLGVWLFLQITFSLSSVAMAVADAGFLPESLTWVQGGQVQTAWFATSMDLFGGQMGLTGRETLAFLNDAELFIDSLAGQFIWQIALALLYLGWLVAWWLRQQQPPTITGDISRS